MRPSAASPAAIASSATICYAACPEDAITKLGPNEGYETQTRIDARVAASASSSAPATPGDGSELGHERGDPAEFGRGLKANG